jgi:hypothetical protein
LSGGQWLRFVVASAVGTYAGLWGGFEIWWPRADPIAGPWVPVGNAIATLATVLVSLLAGFAMRRVSIPNGKARRAVWIAFACCFAFGPVALALTPPLVAFWITRNERAAVRRVESLREAVERVVAETGNPSSICDGQALERAYSGPRFSKNDWLYIVGNYVKQDGYLFSIYCHEKSGFTIAAFPARDNSDGVRHFCTDRSGKLGCGLESNSSRNACIACKQ